MHWFTIASAPREGEFLAERQTTGDWLKVVRNPLYPGDNSVVHPETGLMWVPLRWSGLPKPLTRAEAQAIDEIET